MVEAPISTEIQPYAYSTQELARRFVLAPDAPQDTASQMMEKPFAVFVGEGNGAAAIEASFAKMNLSPSQLKMELFERRYPGRFEADPEEHKFERLLVLAAAGSKLLSPYDDEVRRALHRGADFVIGEFNKEIVKENQKARNEADLVGVEVMGEAVEDLKQFQVDLVLKVTSSPQNV